MKISISGIRGIVGHDFSPKDVLKFCNGFSNIIKSKKCVVACDMRPSSKIIKNFVIASLMQNGIDTCDLGIIPTPVVFYESRIYGAGIMITASHNPISWNGLKCNINGKNIDEDQIIAINKYQNSYQNYIGREIKLNVKYIQGVKKIINTDIVNSKLVIDVCGGTSKKIIKCMLREFKIKPQIINDGMDNLDHTDPVNSKLERLISLTTNSKIGFALDVDGDRLIVAKNGRKWNGDVSILLCIARSIKLGYKKFVISLDTSVTVEKYILNMGCKVCYSKVGELNVVRRIEETDSDAGGEGSSGGFILSKFNYCRDGLLACILISSMTDMQINCILKYSDTTFLVRYKININSNYHDKILSKIKYEMKQYGKIITVDGVKIIINSTNWILIRKSNTEHDVMRISIESDQLCKVKTMKKEINKIIKCFL